MPKRVADEYITKENGSIANTPADDGKPKMSTTAQQVRRKIAQPRGRLGANRSHTPSHTAPNPFAQNPQQQQQTFGTMNDGVTFGASQSFPQASAGTNNSFTFQPPQSSSFTFGAPTDTPNPFTNLNGTADAQDISMESPQKKAAFGNAFGSNNFTFGQTAQQQTNNPFSGFGGNQTANTNGTSLFGQTAATSAPSNPFGQPAQSQPAFGGFAQQSSAPQPQPSGLGFGQSTNAPTPSTSAPFGGFGQNTASTSAPFGGLSQSTSVPQSPLPSFGGQQSTDTQSQPPKFVFGQTNSASQPQGTNAFGSTATSSQSNGSNVFGTAPSQSSNTGFGSVSTTTSAPFSFGQGLNQTAPSTNSFANLGALKSEEPKPATPLFGGAAGVSRPASEVQEARTSPEKIATSGPDAQPVNPFVGLFGSASTTSNAAPAQKPAFSFGPTTETPAPTVEKQEPARPRFAFGMTSQPASKSAIDESQPKPPKSPFTFGTTSQPAAPAADLPEPEPSAPRFKFGSTTSTTGSATSTLFENSAAQPEVPKAITAPETTQEDNAESKHAAPNSSFNFPDPPQSVSSGGLFSPGKPSTNNNASSGGLFSKLNNAVETSARLQPLSGAQPQPASDGSQLQSSPSAAAGTTSSEAPRSSAPPSFGSLYRPEAQSSQTSQRPSMTLTPFGAISAQVSQPSAVKSSPSAASSPFHPQKPAESAKDSAVTLEPVKRPVYTKAPSRVPGHTNAQQFQEFDRDYRLHSLNHGLQQKLATLDPRSHDFDNIIRHYVAARDSIGASLGLYVRNVAGTKRKGDQVDDREDEPELNKRSREGNVQKSFTFGSQTSTAPFGSAPSGPSNAVTTPKTTNSLSEVIPKSTSSSAFGASQTATGFKPATNTFGEFASTSSATLQPFANLSQGTSSLSTASSTTPTKSPPKKLGFEVPKFGGGGNTDFFAAFGQKAKASADKLEKDLLEKRKLEEFDSDEDDEESFRKRIEEENRAKRAKIESIAKGGFMPNFGSASEEKQSSKPIFTGFTAAASSNPFSSLAPKETNEEQSEVDDASSGEDENEASGSSNEQAEDVDEETGDGDDEEEDEVEDDLPEDEVVEENEEVEEEDDDNDLQAAMDRARNNPNAGKSLFDRIEPKPNKERSIPTTNGNRKDPEADSSPIMQSAKNSSFPPSLWGSQIGKSTPEQPSFSAFTPATGVSTVKPASTFNFTPSARSNTPTPAPGASIFSGGVFRDGPVPGEGLFGSRPSTPSNVDKNSGLAKSILTSLAGTDNTWKEGTPISFANGDKLASAPTFKFTAASPGEKDKGSATPKSLGTLFGTPAAGSSGSGTPNLGFQFGTPTSAPAPGFLGAISHFGGGSAASSVVSSRATSPGLTDNESVATNETDDTTTDDPQTSLMDSRVGEENETCLWEGRSKALMFVNTDMAKGTKYTPNDWNSVGVGQIRVLKDKTTNKTRAVFRVEPSANILFNSHLVGSTTYESVPSNKSGAVRGALTYKGSLTRLVFKLKTPEMAKDLAKILEENKSV